MLSESGNKSKQTWNAAHYTQIKFSINPETAAAFKTACAAANVSMAGIISEFMTNYTERPANSTANAVKVATRRQRRATVKVILSQIEQLLFAEECYRDNIPENLQGSKWFESAEQSIAVMQEIIELLEEVY